MRNIIICLALCALLAACATTPEAMDKQDSASLLALINGGKAGELAAKSSQPFVVDQEIVPLREDVGAYWQGMLAAGLKLDPGKPGVSEPLREGSYKSFADSMDLRVFFKKYLDAKARVLRLPLASGRQLLVLVRNDSGKLTIYGVKGPD